MRVRSALAGVVLLAAVGAVTYRFGLSEDAKRSARDAVKSVSDAARSVTERVEDMVGIVVDEEPLHNREQTEREWEALGY